MKKVFQISRLTNLRSIMLELFPQDIRERIEKEGSLQLLVSALLDLAEDSLREEEEAKEESKLIAGKKEELESSNC